MTAKKIALTILLVLLGLILLFAVWWKEGEQRYLEIQERCTAKAWGQKSTYDEDCYGRVLIHRDSAWDPRHHLTADPKNNPIGFAAVHNSKQYKFVDGYLYVISQLPKESDPFSPDDSVPTSRPQDRKGYIIKANTQTGEITRYDAIDEASPQDQVIFRELEKFSER